MHQLHTIKDLLRSDTDEPSFDMSHVHSMLEPEETPPLDHSTPGMQNASRARLVRALAKKYGPNFQTYPHVVKGLKGYDKEIHFHKVLNRLRSLRHG